MQMLGNGHLLSGAGVICSKRGDLVLSRGLQVNQEDSSPVCSLILFSCRGEAIPRDQKVYLEVQACFFPQKRQEHFPPKRQEQGMGHLSKVKNRKDQGVSGKPGEEIGVKGMVGDRERQNDSVRGMGALGEWGGAGLDWSAAICEVYR